MGTDHFCQTYVCSAILAASYPACYPYTFVCEISLDLNFYGVNQNTFHLCCAGVPFCCWRAWVFKIHHCQQLLKLGSGDALQMAI